MLLRHIKGYIERISGPWGEHLSEHIRTFCVRFERPKVYLLEEVKASKAILAHVEIAVAQVLENVAGSDA